MDKEKDLLMLNNFRKLCKAINNGIIQDLKIQNSVPVVLEINGELISKKAIDLKNFDCDKDNRFFYGFEALCAKIQFGQINNLEIKDGRPQIDKLTKKDIVLRVLFDKSLDFVEGFAK